MIAIHHDWSAKTIAFAIVLSTMTACTLPTATIGDVQDNDDESQVEDTSHIDDTSDDPITWHNTIAPIVAEKCQACHQAGGIGPFPMEQYSDVVDWTGSILTTIENGSMPPFDAAVTPECEPQHGFMDDPRLEDDQIDLFRDWVQNGAPEGDPNTAADLPEPPDNSIVDPNAELTLREPFEVNGTKDIYQCFRVEVPNEEHVWLTEVEVLPDNDAVVHHVLVWSDPNNNSANLAGSDGSYPCSGEPGFWPTDLVGAWTPGAQPLRTPEGVGTLFKKGASLVVNVHYHPVEGQTEFDQTGIRLKWTTEPPAKHATWYLIDIPFGASVAASTEGESEFKIPANSSSHTETVVFDTTDYPELFFSLPVFAIGPHMHYRGTEMLVTVKREEETDDECLIHSPEFRFDFQNVFFYDAEVADMPLIHPGDKVEVRCTYNNSSTNAKLLEEGVSTDEHVYWGEETNDEMCMAIVGLVIPPIDLSAIF